MATSSFFLHPSLCFIALALVLPFIKGQLGRFILLLPPILALYTVFTMTDGTYCSLNWIGINLELGRVDPTSRIFSQVFAICSLAGMLYALNVDDRLQHMMASLYVAGGFGCVFAGDFITLFVFWELMSIGSCFLVFCNRTRESVLAAFRYFLYHTFGGLLLLAGIVLRYKATGNFVFDSILPGQNEIYNWLILAGFCVNAAVVPLHAWLTDAYPRATISGAVFMCAFTTKTAVYVLMRGFSGWEVLALMGVIMAIYGVIFACLANNIRRILAYDIVSQVGYMVAGIGIGTHMTLNGVSAHAYAHILYKGLLFMSTGCLIYATGINKLTQLGGLAKKLPWVFIFYMIGAFSISGMPIFNGFVTKTMTIAGAAEAHYAWVALCLEIAVVGTFIPVAIKLPYYAFFGGDNADAKMWTLKPIPWNMYAGMVLLAFMCILPGVAPQMLYAYLPYTTEHPFVPWTVWNVLQALLLLGFSGLAYFLLRKLLTPREGVNLDFDYFYRAIGSFVLVFICRPLAFLDSKWTNVYNIVGLRGLLSLSNTTDLFDRHVIDGVVDNTAYGVNGIGRLGAKLQNGDLQRYIGLTVILALVIFALIWYLG
jgi:multicomponent Na+:H+ antiporter subunit D